MYNSIYKARRTRLNFGKMSGFILNRIHIRHLEEKSFMHDGLSKFLILSILNNCIQETIKHPDKCTKVDQKYVYKKK